jgi:hypothetical protein
LPFLVIPASLIAISNRRFSLAKLVFKGFDGALGRTLDDLGCIGIAFGAHPIGHAVPVCDGRGFGLFAVISLALWAEEADEANPKYYAKDYVKHFTF